MTNLSTQAARDAAPTVAPIEGCYALLRSAEVMGPIELRTHFCNSWEEDGAYSDSDFPSMDIIAVYTPAQLLGPRDHAVTDDMVVEAWLAWKKEDANSASQYVRMKAAITAALAAMETNHAT